MPDSNPKTSLSPMLSVRHGSKAVDFYQAAFDATVLFRIDGGESRVPTFQSTAPNSGSPTNRPNTRTSAPRLSEARPCA